MLQTILNRFINLNPHYLVYLQEMAGRSIAIGFKDIPLKLTLQFRHSWIEVQAGVHNADLSLSATSLDFLIFATKKAERQKLLQHERVVFVGDLQVLERLEKFLNHFQFGLLKLVPMRKIQQFLRNQIEYWQEEKQILASPILGDDFKDQVFSLQQELDRCAARLAVLEACE